MRYYIANNDLPGPKFKAPERQTFHRPQHLQIVRESVGDVDVSNGLRVEDPTPVGKVALLQQKQSGIGGERLNYVAQDEWDPRKSTEERLGWSEHKLQPLSIREKATGRDAPGLPNWVRLQKQILRFDSYFVEDVVAERVETNRLRRCHIFYFLEDNTMMVTEPTVPNSGIPQGTIVRRHRVPFQTLPELDMANDELPRPPPRISKEPYITYWDLNRSEDLMIYGYRHRITDCDPFTHDFLTAQGVQVNPQEPEPSDMYGDYRNKVEAVTARRPYKRPETPRRFQPGEGKVLRFYGRWNDDSGSKEVRNLVVRFHLEDSTVEVGEKHNVNSGRYKAPLFLKRCKLPKQIDKLVALPGMRSDHTLLNVVRSQGPGKSIDAALIDNLETKPGSVIAASGVFADPTTFYSEDDFDIGKTISIAGRDVLLHDCDNFTREYFRNTRNKLLEPLALQQKVEKKTEKEVFPFTGFGSEEDSKASCQHTLEPRAPQRDFFKFMHKDRHGFDSHILRFSARLIHEDKVDVKRKFVIAYFLSDDTILVTLMPEQNSGRHGGRFMKRTKMRKPVDLQSPDMRLDSLFYTPRDLYVGAIVEFNKHTFLLASADEYVFSYMERPAEIENFPQSNLRVILTEVIRCVEENGGIKAMMATFLAKDPDDSGYVMESTFRDILHGFVGYNLSEHQVISIVRAYQSAERRQPSLPTERLYSLLQSELKKINFQFFDLLTMNLQEKDIKGTGKLPKSTIRISLVSGFGASKSSLKSHYVNHVVEMLMKSIPEEELNYKDLIFRLNWVANPAKPVAPDIVRTNFDDNARQENFVPVNYRRFVETLESKMEPGRQNYIPTEEDFANDRGRN